ncbi:DUF1423 domain-containing protein [Cephalotus follicularis]|uniref:DUF1423 domain-containing protein n=1 Tax=Cephalotus follicularis TaxID=3775 RepID=A0A1Q3D0Q0_CEPFO|nr:DUF1423 domain-containing protein [Cephalotus follicularis]
MRHTPMNKNPCSFPLTADPLWCNLVEEMKRLRSSEDLDSYEKTPIKESNPNRSSTSSSSHRSFYYNKPDNARKNRDRSTDEDLPRMTRKRSDHDFDSFDRRKGFDRYRAGGGGGGGEGYNGNIGGGENRGIYRSESFCGTRREFPKGFRSERDRSRREGSVSSWRRFKDFDDINSNNGSSRGGESKDSVERGKGSREVRDNIVTKSPSWSRESGSEQTRMRGDGEGKEKERKSKSRASPTWSKDSGSEPSKSVEVKKSEEVQGESERSSEMEEGELQPEPEVIVDGCDEPKSVSGNVSQVKENVGFDGDTRKVDDIERVVEDVEKELNKEDVNDQGGNTVKEVVVFHDSENALMDRAIASEDEAGDVSSGCGDEVDKGGESLKESGECEVEKCKDNAVLDKPLHLEEESKQDNRIDLQVQVENKIEGQELTEEDAGLNGNGGNEVKMDVVTKSLFQNFKDKGKGVAVSLSHVIDSVEDGVWIGREPRNMVTDEDDDMEGPSIRGFELFSTSPIRRSEKPEQWSGIKQKDEKLELEPLDLSLSLPNVLLPIGARDTGAAAGSPSQARSVQSLTNTFQTNSDGFTASMSFSGSQSFYHNPSCSLTQNSLDNFEQSVHSRPIFQGIDQGAWQGQSQYDSRHKEVPLYQRILMNGNGSLQQPQALESISNGQAAQGHHLRAQEGSSKMPNGLERHLSFHKQNDVRSPSQSVGSHEMGSNYSFEKKRAAREKHGGSFYRSNSFKEQEQLLIGGADFVETIIGRIVSEPIHAMSRKFHEMTAQSVSCLKESIREILLKGDKHVQLSAIQKSLQNRSDLTLEVLLKSHRSQLEILVALKTGLPEFLHLDNSVSSSDLAEILLNLRCRNLTCRNPLPVDECDCKVCVKKNGFCSACMCLVCSMFDMASNTCSWVGCDVCLHWCHADCGLRESYIRNGRSATGPQGTTEMQFHCVACDHPSEMFGFVKEVFQNFAKEWTAETFAKELEYVKRIFSASKDARGRRLHEFAEQMLARLANKSNFPEVYNHIMGFLTESDSSMFSNISDFTGKESKEQLKSSSGIAGPSQDTTWCKHTEKPSQLERSASGLPIFQSDRNDKLHVESELQRSSQKEPLFDELESIIRIKQAEAKMFQARADDARREAEGLKRIAVAKNEKVEEEYVSRIAKLRLVEAEEMRKQKFEEFQALERAHREYFNMKMRMEADIKELLSKMEATKRNLMM